MSERLKRCLNLSAADFRIVRVIYKERFDDCVRCDVENRHTGRVRVSRKKQYMTYTMCRVLGELSTPLNYEPPTE